MLAFWVALVAALMILIVWDPLNYRQNPQTPLARMIAWIRARLVDDVGSWWRWWSVRFNVVGLMILGWVQFDPIGVLAVWNMMPLSVRQLLPGNFVNLAGLALFGLSMLARLVKQKPKGSANAQ